MSELFSLFSNEHQFSFAPATIFFTATDNLTEEQALSLAMDESVDDMILPDPEASEECPESTDPRLVCKICLTNTVSTVLYPCRHVIACVTCARALFPRRCSVCRCFIQRIHKIYLT